MQQRCPNCGSPIAPGQRFCGGCGSQISLSCPNCRITVSPGTRFCPNCGATLGGGPPQQPGGMPQQQPGWGQPPGGMPPQQPGWGQPPGGMPPQQPGWGQQPAWAPPAPRPQTSSSRPFLVILLIVLLIGLGFLTYKYTPLYGTVMGFFKSSTSEGTAAATDTTKPVTSNFKETVGPTSASITWATDDLSSTQVEYGKTSAYGSVMPAQPDFDPSTGTSLGVIDHAVTLTGLEPDTTYHYRIKSKNAAGLEEVSADRTFTTTTPEAAPEE